MKALLRIAAFLTFLGISLPAWPQLGPGGGSGSTGSQSELILTYQPGSFTTLVGQTGKAAFTKFFRSSTVDNIEGASLTFTCSVNPTITVFECGTSATCAAPTTIGTVTISAANTATDGTVNSSAIAAGDYVAFAITAGTCTVLDPAVVVQAHAN